MKKAIVLHGTQGSPEGNWFRWLEAELQKKGFEVWLPQLPHAEQPSLSVWLGFVSTNCPFTLDEGVLVIGHSSGATLALALGAHNKAGAVVAVSPFVPTEDSYPGTEWEANAHLFDIDFDWGALKRNVSKRLILCSDDDPYIPLKVFMYIADHSETELVVIPNQGHYNLEHSENYREFPLLVELLTSRDMVSHNVIQIVDEHDNPVKGGTKEEAQQQGLWHRIVRVMLQDESGMLLLQKRAKGVLSPECWDFSSSGHVDEGEDYETAALRELGEELSLDGIVLTKTKYGHVERKTSEGLIFRRFFVAFSGQIAHDQEIDIDREEVAAVRWWTLDELKQAIAENPDEFTHGLRQAVEWGEFK